MQTMRQAEGGLAMPGTLPDTALLAKTFPPTWVRAVFVVRAPLGIGAATAAPVLAAQVRSRAAERTSGISISNPELSGGSFVMDFRIKRTVEAGRFAQELEGLAGGGLRTMTPFGSIKLDVVSLELLAQTQLKQANAPTERRVDVIEAEETRREATTSPRDVFAAVADTFKFARGALVAVIIAAALWAGWPFLKAAGVVAKKTAAKKGG